MKTILSFVISFLLFCCSMVEGACNDCYDYYWYEGYPPCSLQDCNGNNFYAELFSGASFLHTGTIDGVNIDYQTGYIISGSYGYRLGYGFRIEGEYAFRKDQIKPIRLTGSDIGSHGHFQSSSYMANLLWDLSLRRYGICLKPFVGGGIGYDVVQNHGCVSGVSLRDNKKGFSWQAIAGVSYPFYRNMELSIEYKLHQGPSSSIYSHNVGIGFIYTFCGC